MIVPMIHWMLKEPPCPDTIKTDDGWVLEVSGLGELLSLTDDFDIMLQRQAGQLLIRLDDKGRRFSQR